LVPGSQFMTGTRAIPYFTAMLLGSKAPYLQWSWRDQNLDVFVPSFNPKSSTGLTKRKTQALEAAPLVITTLNTPAEVAFTLKLGHVRHICSLLFQSLLLLLPHLVTLDN